MSIVIPAKDAALVVGIQLSAVARQRASVPFEVVVADNGSTDGTIAVVEAFHDRLADLRVVLAADRPGGNHARNVGARAAKGDLLVFVDADDEVVDGWLSALVAAARDADLVGGPTDTTTLNAEWSHTARVVDSAEGLPVGMHFLPYVLAGNCAVWRDVFEDVGGWDESYVAGGDEIALSWRAQLAGHVLAFAPEAILRYRFRPTITGQCRQMYRYGQADPRLYREFRAYGAPKGDTRAFLNEVGWLIVHLPTLVMDRTRRTRWLRKAAWRAGRLVGSARSGVWFP